MAHERRRQRQPRRKQSRPHQHASARATSSTAAAPLGATAFRRRASPLEDISETVRERSPAPRIERRKGYEREGGKFEEMEFLRVARRGYFGSSFHDDFLRRILQAREH